MCNCALYCQLCNCVLYCEQSAGISLSEVCTVRQGVTHTVHRVQQVLHVQYAMCSTQCSMFKVQHAGVTQRVSPAPASAPSRVQNALELKPSSAILCTLCSVQAAPRMFHPHHHSYFPSKNHLIVAALWGDGVPLRICFAPVNRKFSPTVRRREGEGGVGWSLRVNTAGH